jgi:cytochrome b6-f complex iron-sulfur subunit
MQSTARRERTLTPRVHTRPGAEDTQGGIVEGATRRDFLRLTLLGTLGAMLLGGVGAFVAYFYPKQTSAFGSKITAPVTVADIKSDPSVIHRVREGKFYLSPIQLTEGENAGKLAIIALYWKCKHLGCTVPWKPEEEFSGNQGIFRCPCHGSIYLRNGQNVAGPAPAPLDYMEVTFEGERIVVNTGKITTRVQYDPKQVTVLPG